MSAFYVGQKVKKVRGKCGIGITGTVTSSPAKRTDLPGDRIDVLLDAPTFNERGIFFAVGEETATPPELWEPIIPPGLESIEEINALWETEPAKVLA